MFSVTNLHRPKWENVYCLCVLNQKRQDQTVTASEIASIPITDFFNQPCKTLKKKNEIQQKKQQIHIKLHVQE